MKIKLYMFWKNLDVASKLLINSINYMIYCIWGFMMLHISLITSRLAKCDGLDVILMKIYFKRVCKFLFLGI